MKIQPNIPTIPGLAKAGIIKEHIFEKGQIVSGKIISITGKELDIILSQGSSIKALAQDGVNLPLNTKVSFQVLDNTGEILMLRPVMTDQQIPVGRDRVLIGIVSELGIKSTPNNIDFIDNNSNIISKGIEKLINMLHEEGNIPAALKLQEIFIGPAKLAEYLKGFNEGSMERLIKQLHELLGEVRKNSKYQGVYTKVLGDIAKSFIAQLNHQFPLFFIPVPLHFNNKFYPGEIWIEKDQVGERQYQDQICLYILTDTPNFGRVEVDIKGSDKEINIDFYCRDDIVPLFSENLDTLKGQLSLLSINIKSLDVRELKHTRGFTDLIQKYVQPFPAVDIKI